MIIATPGAVDALRPVDALATLPAGTRLLIELPSGRSLAEAVWTCWSRRFVAVPVDPRLPDSRRRFIAEHALAAARWNGALEWLDRGAEPSPAGDGFIMYTSGSTGDRNGVVLTRDAVEHNARAVAALHGLDRGAHATCLPLFHCNALMMSLMGTGLHDGTLVLHTGLDPEAYFADLARHEVAVANIVPALLHCLVEAAPPWPPSLRYLLTAAAPLPRQLARRFYALYGPRLCQGFGLTEAVNFSCTMPALDDAGFRAAYLDADPPVGPPLPGTRLRLVHGAVQVTGPNLMRGYWRNPEATAEAFDGEWLRTGDLGAMRGDWLVLVGRQKEVINRGGETIYPVDFEERATEAGLATPLAAMAIPDLVLGDAIRF